jgi:hypothetical protein
MSDRLMAYVRSLDKESTDYDVIAPERWPPLEAITPARKPVLCVYVAKPVIVHRWYLDQMIPSDWIVISRSGLPTIEHCAMVNRLREHLPVVFVGDLDPLDIHLYWSLRRGNVALEGADRKWMLYGGILDAWLELCHAYLRSSRRLDEVLIRMGSAEKRHFRELSACVPHLNDLLGPRCFQLLAAGWKLELEGATSSAVYRIGLQRRIIEMIRRFV